MSTPAPPAPVEQAPAPAPVPMEPAPAPATAPALVRHTMVTRLRNAITKPVILTDGTIRYEYKHRAFLAAPASYRTALGDACWRAAMEDEHSALLRNGTWTLVPRPPGQNVIGSRLVFKVKQKADGSVDKFKARLVTQGFTQRCGVDYFDTCTAPLLSQLLCDLCSPWLCHITGVCSKSTSAMHSSMAFWRRQPTCASRQAS